MKKPRISYGDKVTVGFGWNRMVTLDGTVTFAIEVMQGRPKECDYGWGHDWHANVIDVYGTTLYTGRIRKQNGARTILEQAGLMGPELSQGRDLERGAVVLATQDARETRYAVVDPEDGRVACVTTAQSTAYQLASVADWARRTKSSLARQQEAGA